MSDASDPRPASLPNLTRVGAGVWAAVALLTLLAAAPRLYRCFEWPLDGDEIYTLQNSRVIAWGVDPALLSGKIYALCPLSFYLNRPLVDGGWDDRIALRLVPLVAGIVAVPLLFWLTRREFGPRVAWPAGLLLAISSYHVEVSQYGRFYSLAFLLANLALFLFANAIRRQSTARLVVSQIVLLLGIATHLPVAFLVATEIVYLAILWIWPESPGRDRSFPRRALAWLAAISVGLAIYLWPAVGEWTPVKQAGARDPVELILGWAGEAGLGVFVFNGIAMLYFLASRNRLAWLFVLAQAIPGGILLLLSLAEKTVVPSYVGFGYFPMFVVCGLLIAEMTSWIETQGKPWRQWLFAPTLLLIVAAAGLPSLESHFRDGNRHDFPDAAATIDDWSPQGAVVFSSWSHVLAYHAERRFGVDRVWMPAAGTSAKEILAAAEAKRIVIRPLSELVDFARSSERGAGGQPAIFAVVVVDRSGVVDDRRGGVVKKILDQGGFRRREFTVPRHDYRRNRLDLYEIRPAR